MKRFFDSESPLMTALAAAADLLILNILTILCLLPAVTGGAALTAVCAHCGRLIRGEEGSTLKGFFRSFRENFKKGTALWLIILAAAGLLYFDYLAAVTYVPPMRFGIAAIGILVLALALYAFPLLARYENTLRNTLKNAAALAVAWFPRTLLMLAFTLGFWLAGIRFIHIGAPLLLMFGFSMPLYICSLLLRDVFDNLEKRDSDGEQ